MTGAPAMGESSVPIPQTQVPSYTYICTRVAWPPSPPLVMVCPLPLPLCGVGGWGGGGVGGWGI